MWRYMPHCAAARMTGTEATPSHQTASASGPGAFNRSRLRTVLAVVLTTNLRIVDAPGNVLIPAKAAGLTKDSVANVTQVITVDREFLTELAGHVRGQLLKDVDNGLRLVVGL